MNFRISKTETDKLAKTAGYDLIDFQEKIGMVSYWQDGVRINIYLTKLTVATCIDHPKKGKTQLFRKNITIEQLKKIFDNPRQHTGKGYYEKRVR